MCLMLPYMLTAVNCAMRCRCGRHGPRVVTPPRTAVGTKSDSLPVLQHRRSAEVCKVFQIDTRAAHAHYAPTHFRANARDVGEGRRPCQTKRCAALRLAQRYRREGCLAMRPIACGAVRGRACRALSANAASRMARPSTRFISTVTGLVFVGFSYTSSASPRGSTNALTQARERVVLAAA
jgi:hypothetical protein